MYTRTYTHTHTPTHAYPYLSGRTRAMARPSGRKRRWLDSSAPSLIASTSPPFVSCCSFVKVAKTLISTHPSLFPSILCRINLCTRKKVKKSSQDANCHPPVFFISILFDAA